MYIKFKGDDAKQPACNSCADEYRTTGQMTKPGLPNFDTPVVDTPKKLIGKDKESVSVGLPFNVRHEGHMGSGTSLGSAPTPAPPVFGASSIPAPIAAGAGNAGNLRARTDLVARCRSQRQHAADCHSTEHVQSAASWSVTVVFFFFARLLVSYA